ncbi:hypothetical protein [Paenibacillus rhizoplanae]|uniref:hypothetical protein n=1 Tax=Paenibacillus rhizoplanae TaxID=1917181 RepID=UPI003618C52E
MKPYPWMTSYAVADDIYMCHLASRYGKLVINPELKIMHHESPSSRDKAGRVARATAVNHYYLLNLRKAPVKLCGSALDTDLSDGKSYPETKFQCRLGLHQRHSVRP